MFDTQNSPNPGRERALHTSTITLIKLHIQAMIIPIRNQIHLIQPYKPRPLNQLPRRKHAHHNRDLDVEGDEIDGLEGRAEAGPALHEDQDDIQADGDDGAYGIRPVLEGEEVLQVLGADGGAEA